MTERAAATRKENTSRRNQIILQDFNEIYAQKIDGIKLDFDGVLDKVAERHGYSRETIRKILKQRH